MKRAHPLRYEYVIDKITQIRRQIAAPLSDIDTVLNEA